MGEGVGHMINRKMTIGKIKKYNMKGQKCTSCGWRKITSDLTNKCQHCNSF